MTASLVPETAPFDSAQRAWLNGFLAGWLGVDGAPPPADVPGAPQLMLGGPTAVESLDAEEEFPWHDAALPLHERMALADGKPHERRLMAAMAQLDCGACGYLCQTYSEAIARGEEKSLTLCSPGGKETAKKLKELVKLSVPPTATLNGATSNPATPTTTPSNGAAYGRANPFTARLLESRNLNGAGSAKHTSHVVIDLADSGLSYGVGDSLGVYPTNCPTLVEDILGSLRLAGDEPVTASNGVNTTLRDALTQHADLGSVEEELLELLIESTDDFDQRARLQSLIGDDALDELDVLELVRMAPAAQTPPEAFAQALGVLNPRLYSIASSLAAHPREVHLTVGRVAYQKNGRERKGVASTMFADRLPAGSAVRVFVQPSHGFTVPADPTAAMIMVGPGTGIAPFRAFLEEREAARAPGKNWLFFGDQCAATDYLYQEQLSAMQSSGLLTRIDTAFSRDQQAKVYVQDRMRAAGAELFAWLEAGAYFFVCGDAKRMAVDVDRALHEVIAEHGARDEASARAYVEALRNSKRYVRDVY
ncbi:Sulfite reductase [NADPH] flavoprotein alpha-component [Pirellulimonas nuda]|uniref:assimilatory sulfite reductase (NADPH) n=1 Tax=Pirellulimonas nuda TaxID=2528009 RepID=A0A518DG50_9BACT|nr:sulfite reductase subunit alpha [Pirellulimonas nuda]QDU90456.1 Sulfite reductase [NADPH] flavoprotein alpha-component [Pirellulimonas nuda]